MSYKFAVENINYQDYASGRVLFNQRGTTSFPVRLASEIFQRCRHIINKKGINSPYKIYDPCCGGAYLLTTIGYLHGEHISKIFASDIDESAIKLAERNLSLLSILGIKDRIEQINKMTADYGKYSHFEALESAFRLLSILESKSNIIGTKCFISDSTKNMDKLDGLNNINIVITDLPYGDIVHWSNMQDENEAIILLLEHLLPKLAINSVVAIISKEKISIKHDKYKRLEHFKIGKRHINILTPIFNS
ncbi:hypothetical protein ACQPU1_12140 [Clostridium paraputrificum]|uniref:hypothetical protein n=1 Tax=Clostridium paraputrificum TaxID=29363 RepID=UPI003D3281A7